MLLVILLYVAIPQAIVLAVWWLAVTAGFPAAGIVGLALFAALLFAAAIYFAVLFFQYAPGAPKDDPDFGLVVFHTVLIGVSAIAAAATSLFAIRRLRQIHTGA